MRNKSFRILLLVLLPVVALGDPPSNGKEKVPEPPGAVEASDGVYDKFVLIRWEASKSARLYKVFRTTNPNGKALQEINSDWQESTWLCDYTALPGVNYYYAVTALGKDGPSSLSDFDKGYIKNDPVANDELLSNNDIKIAEPPKVFLQFSNLTTERSSYAPGDEVELNYVLQNVFDKATKRTEIHLFLSQDVQWNWEDKAVNMPPKVYSSFPAESNSETSIKFTIPESISPGKYYLIFVSSPEGEILSSRIATVPVNIISE